MYDVLYLFTITNYSTHGARKVYNILTVKYNFTIYLLR